MDDHQQPDIPWNAPTPGTTWQPGSPTAGSELVTEVPLLPLSTEPKRKGRRVVAIGAAAALIAAGGFAMVQVAGGGAEGGAATPVEAVQQLVASINAEDALGAMDMLLPGERRTFKQPMIDMVAELSRLEILDTTAKLDAVSGTDVEVTLAADLETTEVAPDIATVQVAGSAKANVDTSKIPIGTFLIDNMLDGTRPDGIETASGDFGGDAGDPIPVTVVKRDGRWYVSLWYSVAEAARQQADATLPTLEEAIKPQGAESPEKAVGAMIEAVASFDLEAIIAGMNPNEAEVLQRYAPIFLADGQDSVDGLVSDVSAKLKVDDLTYEVTKDGDNDATVDVKTLALNGEIDGGAVSIGYDGDCYTVELSVPDSEPETTKTCNSETNEELSKSGLGFLARATRNAGIRVSKVDGKWYVSPFGTVTHSVVSVLKQLKRADLSELSDSFGDFAQGASDQLGVDVPGLPTPDETLDTVFLPIDETFDTIPTDTFDTTLDTTFETVADFPTDDAAGACYAEFEYEPAVACFQAGLAAATITPDEIPVQLRFPECGLGEPYWTGYFQMSDAEFIAAISAASPCFADKVAAGALFDYEVPFETIKPECFNGVNPYAMPDVEAGQVVYDAYAACASA